MKALTLTSALFVALSLTVSAQSTTALRSQISLKEKQLTEIQKELAQLRDQLNAAPKGQYTVKTGDTVHSIARRHNVSATQIMTWNDISDPTKLRIGDSLKVSATHAKPSPQPSTPMPIAGDDYKVSKGDTFYSIARRHQMSLAQLRELNPDVKVSLIAPGQTLKVAGKAIVKSQPKPEPATKAIAKTNPKPTRKAQPKAQPKREAIVKREKPAPRVEAKKAVAKKAAPAKAKTQSQPVINRDPRPVTKVAKITKAAAPAPPVIAAPKPKKSTVESIIVNSEMSFGEFAGKHGTSIEELNALNNWKLPSSIILARGSEILVPQ